MNKLKFKWKAKLFMELKKMHRRLLSLAILGKLTNKYFKRNCSPKKSHKSL